MRQGNCDKVNLLYNDCPVPNNLPAEAKSLSPGNQPSFHKLLLAWIAAYSENPGNVNFYNPETGEITDYNFRSDIERYQPDVSRIAASDTNIFDFNNLKNTDPSLTRRIIWLISQHGLNIAKILLEVLSNNQNKQYPTTCDRTELITHEDDSLKLAINLWLKKYSINEQGYRVVCNIDCEVLIKPDGKTLISKLTFKKIPETASDRFANFLRHQKEDNTPLDISQYIPAELNSNENNIDKDNETNSQSEKRKPESRTGYAAAITLGLAGSASLSAAATLAASSFPGWLVASAVTVTVGASIAIPISAIFLLGITALVVAGMYYYKSCKNISGSLANRLSILLNDTTSTKHHENQQIMATQ